MTQNRRPINVPLYFVHSNARVVLVEYENFVIWEGIRGFFLSFHDGIGRLKKKFRVQKTENVRNTGRGGNLLDFDITVSIESRPEINFVRNRTPPPKKKTVFFGGIEIAARPFRNN